MKNLLLTGITFILLFVVTDLDAQNRRAKAIKRNHKHKTIVHKKKQKRIRTHKRIKRTKLAHYHYRHLPKRGAILRTIHKNAIIVKHRNVGYRFHSGIWYKPKGKKWVIVHPPHGIRIRTLPVGYRKVFIGPKTYYYYYGTYYTFNNNNYEVIEAPVNAEVDSLPDGYNTINVNGEDYYELDGIYYTTGLNTSGEEVLIVVKNPTL